MFKYYLPYGTNHIEIELLNKVDILKPNFEARVILVENSLKEAFEKPINFPPLHEFLKDKNNIAISIEDDTRPIDNKKILEILFAYLRERKISGKNIKIIVATGLHKDNTLYDFSEISYDFSVEVIKHNPDKDLIFIEDENLGKVGINKEFIEADARIVIGDVVPHQIFGFSGPPKSIIPGLCDRETINKTHRQVLYYDLKAGRKDNIVRKWVEEFSKKIPNIFAINLLQNMKKEIIEVIAGDLITSFQKAIEKSEKMYCVKIEKYYDTVITSPGGYPIDQDLYQTQKAFTHASYATKKGGKIIVFSPCTRGWGSKDFMKITMNLKDINETINNLRENFSVGKHKLLFFLELAIRYNLYLYSEYDFSNSPLAKFINVLSKKDLKDIVSEKENTAIIFNGNFTVPIL